MYETNKMDYITTSIITLINLWSLLSEKSELRISETHKYKILQYTDLHFGTNIAEDLKTLSILTKLENYGKPNFIALTGDIISDRCEWNSTISQFFSKICWYIISNSIQTDFAFTLGNHDCEEGILHQRQLLIEYAKKWSHCHNVDQEGWGATFYIPIYSSFNKSNIALILWFFDTRDHECNGNKNSWGCVQDDQINWFLQNDIKLRKLYGNYYTSLAFAHVPPSEFVTL